MKPIELPKNLCVARDWSLGFPATLQCEHLTRGTQGRYECTLHSNLLFCAKDTANAGKPMRCWQCEMTGEFRKFHIGDVHVAPFDCTNPYTDKSEYVIGDGRVAALQRFADGELCKGLQLWFAPAGGGAYRINPDQVDWTIMGPRTVRR